MNAVDQASRWFAALRRGAMALEEQAEYEAWITQRENRIALAEMEQLWNSLEDVAHAIPPASVGRKVMMATLCAVSAGLAILSWTSNSGFWTSLDWMNR